MNGLPRSYLFVPGSRPDRFAKAAATGAEALIIDLEDAVAENQKDEARHNVVSFLTARPDFHQKIVVRINPIGRACGMLDLAALAQLSGGPDIILLPKAEDPAELNVLTRVLDDAGSAARLAALVETAYGITRAQDVARASARLDFLMFGAADYAADLGQQVGSFNPEYARAAIVNAAAAGGIAAIDSPFFAIDAPDALLAECNNARFSGFHGKAAIHPSQIDVINLSFAPSEKDIQQARRILDAAPDGVGMLDGKMIDIAMIKWAKRVA